MTKDHKFNLKEQRSRVLEIASPPMMSISTFQETLTNQQATSLTTTSKATSNSEMKGVLRKDI